MSNSISYEDAVSRLASQSDAIGRLAQDGGAFAAVVAAFESKDPDAFRWILERLEMLPYCDLICEWIRIKLGVLRCIEICGISRDDAPVPTLEQFARAIVDLSSNERLLRRVVDAVSCGDHEQYQAVISELQLNGFCHLICHWVYSIIYRRVCEVVCSPQRLSLPDAVGEIRAAGRAMARVIADEKAIATIGKAAEDLDCEILQSSLDRAGFGPYCEILCGVICAWRHVWVCRELCELRTPVLTGSYGIEEARSFALAGRQFASQPRALTDLVNAVQNRNAERYSAIVGRFGLEPYCFQVCAWVSSVLCHEFCICVCPPPVAHPPLFTNVGNFDIYSEIDPSTGLTNTSLPTSLTMPFGGGPNFAFYNCLQLSGFCPTYSPTSPGIQMKYRFLYATATTTLTAAISSVQTSIAVASSAGVPATPFNVSLCSNCGTTGGPVETLTVTGVSGTTWTVLRGQDGTTAISAAAGATLSINPAPITGNLVCPVQVGAQWISWPTSDLFGNATAIFTSQQESVWIVPPLPSPPNPPFTAPADPLPPAPGSPWYPPLHNITPDANGWVPVDESFIAGCAITLLGFDTTQPEVAPGGDPLPDPIGTPGGTPAGSAVPVANQGVGTTLSIIFEATRVGAAVVDFSNSLCRIHVNNWIEINNLWFLQFGTGFCCTPISTELSVQFTVDHELMHSGAWSMAITSCSASAPGDITPTVSSAGPPPVTVSSRGGWGTIDEDTTAWANCSYVVSLVTRPGLTTGLADRTAIDNQLTFCICGH
jgi:hypothetical protein